MALEQLVIKDERKVTQLKGTVRGHNKDLEKILNAKKAKERQLAMFIAQLERLRANTKPKRKTMELFSEFARLCCDDAAAYTTGGRGRNCGPIARVLQVVQWRGL